jgi:hypothetical protein
MGFPTKSGHEVKSCRGCSGPRSRPTREPRAPLALVPLGRARGPAARSFATNSLSNR